MSEADQLQAGVMPDMVRISVGIETLDDILWTSTRRCTRRASMISYQVIEHGQPLQANFLSTPQPKGTEVLVRITRSGVCHSDLHIWEGYFELGGGRRFYVKERGCVPPLRRDTSPSRVEAVGPRARE